MKITRSVVAFLASSIAMTLFATGAAMLLVSWAVAPAEEPSGVVSPDGLEEPGL